jgi:hypothetical protein
MVDICTYKTERASHLLDSLRYGHGRSHADKYARESRFNFMSPVVASRSSLVCKVKFSENYSHGKWFQKATFARSPSSNYMSRPRPSRSSEKQNDAARQVGFCGSTCDWRKRDKDLALKTCAPGMFAEWGLSFDRSRLIDHLQHP